MVIKVIVLLLHCVTEVAAETITAQTCSLSCSLCFSVSTSVCEPLAVTDNDTCEDSSTTSGWTQQCTQIDSISPFGGTLPFNALTQLVISQYVKTLLQERDGFKTLVLGFENAKKVSFAFGFMLLQ